MKPLHSVLVLLGAGISSGALAQEWTFKPEIYARGGTVLKSDFSRQASYNRDSHKPFNLGPYNDDGQISNPLTEATIHIGYGEQFKYHFGVDVYDNHRNQDKSDMDPNRKSFLAERVNYGEYLMGNGASIWFGNRPFRSEPEYLTRAFLLDERNILGGGVRFEAVGPVNLEFAYGAVKNDYDYEGAVEENTNVFINKVEVPTENGMLKTNIDIQQTKQTRDNGVGEGSFPGYSAGFAWQRWGMKVLGGDLYNQLVVNYTHGWTVKTGINSSAFATDLNAYDKEHPASKWNFTWNGDWKSPWAALYWAGIYQNHQGKAEGVDKKELNWQTLDGIIRPMAIITPNLNAGIELARRSVLNEGDELANRAGWASNSGSSRWAGLLTYTLEGKNFALPTIGVYAGEISKDQKQTYWRSDRQEHKTHFVQFFYEVKIN